MTILEQAERRHEQLMADAFYGDESEPATIVWLDVQFSDGSSDYFKAGDTAHQEMMNATIRKAIAEGLTYTVTCFEENAD